MVRNTSYHRLQKAMHNHPAPVTTKIPVLRDCKCISYQSFFNANVDLLLFLGLSPIQSQQALRLIPLYMYIHCLQIHSGSASQEAVLSKTSKTVMLFDLPPHPVSARRDILVFYLSPLEALAWAVGMMVGTIPVKRLLSFRRRGSAVDVTWNYGICWFMFMLFTWCMVHYKLDKFRWSDMDKNVWHS